MDEQITQLDRRLTSVEVEVASLAAQASSTRAHYATKEDVAKLDARVSIIQSNYATREGLANLDNKLSGQIAAMHGKLSGDIAELDSKLSSEIAALKLQVSELENRMMRWSLATIITISGVVVAVVKVWP